MQEIFGYIEIRDNKIVIDTLEPIASGYTLYFIESIERAKETFDLNPTSLRRVTLRYAHIIAKKEKADISYRGTHTGMMLIKRYGQFELVARALIDGNNLPMPEEKRIMATTIDAYRDLLNHEISLTGAN